MTGAPTPPPDGPRDHLIGQIPPELVFRREDIHPTAARMLVKQGKPLEQYGGLRPEHSIQFDVEFPGAFEKSVKQVAYERPDFDPARPAESLDGIIAAHTASEHGVVFGRLAPAAQAPAETPSGEVTITRTAHKYMSVEKLPPGGPEVVYTVTRRDRDDVVEKTNLVVNADSGQVTGASQERYKRPQVGSLRESDVKIPLNTDESPITPMGVIDHINQLLGPSQHSRAKFG